MSFRLICPFYYNRGKLMKVSRFVSVCLGGLTVTALAIGSAKSANAGCTTGSCGAIPPGITTPTVTTPQQVGGVVPGVSGGGVIPNSAQNSTSNSGSSSNISNQLIGGQSSSNILGVSIGGNTPPGSISFNLEGCSFTRNGSAWSINGAISGTTGFNDNSPVNGSVIFGYTSFSYDNPGDLISMCKQKLEIVIASAQIDFCTRAKIARDNGVRLNNQNVLHLCNFTPVVVVEAPPAPAAVTPPPAAVQPPVEPAPPAHPTRRIQTGDLPTGRH
jgi:hypothetical protein